MQNVNAGTISFWKIDAVVKFRGWKDLGSFPYQSAHGKIISKAYGISPLSVIWYPIAWDPAMCKY